MKNIRLIAGPPQKFCIILLAICSVLVRCAEDESIAPAVMEEPAYAAELQTGSVSITGTYASFSEEVACGTCTFVVPSSTTTFDGAEHQVKPGDMICLQKSAHYGELEFVNVNGTAELPVRIGYCTE